MPLIFYQNGRTCMDNDDIVFYVMLFMAVFLTFAVSILLSW